MQDFKKKKKFILRELARLEKMNWSADPKVADLIFPYVIVEAINVILNSTLNEKVVDYTKTGVHADEIIDGLIDESFEVND